jgi:hypothetical protein
MKFNFSIIGYSKSNTEIEFIEMLQELMNDWNYNHPSVPDQSHVLVREDGIQE